MLYTRSANDYLKILSICEGVDRRRCQPQTAIDLLSSAPQLNHPKASLDLAMLYHSGILGVFENMNPGKIVVKKDFKKAAQWLRRAAELGAPWAQWHMGHAYSGRWKGFSPDSEKAAAWNRKAAFSFEMKKKDR